MKAYMYTKTLSVIVGTLTIIVAIGFGILSFIGMALSKVFSTGNDYSSTDNLIMFIPIILLLFGLITVVAPFRLKRKAWKIFYIGYCLMLGLGFVITFFITFGALGFKSEIFILCIGMIYLCLSYLAKKGV